MWNGFEKALTQSYQIPTLHSFKDVSKPKHFLFNLKTSSITVFLAGHPKA